MNQGLRDVVVVGAGPAGSATATFLAERGLDVLLLDRATFPRPKPCAEYLSPASIRVLDRLGVVATLIERGAARLTGMRVVSPDGSSFTGQFSAPHGFPPYADYGLALPREQLDAVLAANAQARGAEFRDGVGVGGLSIGPAAVTLETRSRAGVERISARLVIGADGLNSRVARKLGLSRRGRLHRVALVSHVRGVEEMGDVGEMHVAYRAYVGLAPVGNGLVNVAMVADLSRSKPFRSPGEWFLSLLDDFPEVRRRLRHSVPVTPVRAVGPFARSTTRATADRVLLVGDAADFHDPFTGEGIHSALAGAELAATHASNALDRDRTAARDLRAYDGARRHAFAGKWVFEKIVSRAVASPRIFNHIASRLSRDSLAAGLMVGAAGDFVPVSRLLRPSYVWRLVA